MKRHTLSQLDRLECLLWLIRVQKVEIFKKGKGYEVLLPSLQNPKPDQELFWENILRVCGQKLLYIQDLGRLQQVAKGSKIIKDLPIHNGVLILDQKPEAFDMANIRRIDSAFAENLQYFVGTISTFSRGNAPTYVFNN